MNLSRRKFLRGSGIALGLPWLESINSFGADAVKNNTAPRRLAVCFTGNGVNPHHWGATQGAGGMEFMKTLSPLEPIKKHISVFKGLWNPTTVEGEGGHYPKMNVLCGLKVKKTTTDVEVGTTMDQLVAAQTGKFTPVPCVVLGTERPSYSTDSGFTSIYSAYISWSTPTTPAPKEIFPQQAFDQLFDDGSKRKRDKSILDLVMQDAGALKPKLSQRDKQKLDEYLTSVREIEQRVELAEKISQAETRGAGWQPTVKVPTLARPGSGIPTSSEDHLRLMFDIMLLAFQMDRTRVATFMMNNDLSNMRFPSLDGISGGIHELSHHANDEHRLDMYQRVNQHQVKLWGEFLTKMQATNEGERTLLENSMVMLTSSLFDGNAHDSRQLPVVLAGNGGGTIQAGRFHDLSADPNRKMCRLHIALMDRMGLHVGHFGDAENALAI
ncbi:DUF1552 domain-containing protein [Prosthecobacter vanneervenii]|uniref:DUF1552 domain-containing protein n=1 Tax=Prosthecobacter vanneervenii TaxID=48466 RepID=A0A7W8DK54_9BACT|nr:DUF1552 domain-containing protein [Prosthecobacter vanneervenii]MBB5032868.1 hypothetical protein [Prosthecobacter vanneervenii]